MAKGPMNQHKEMAMGSMPKVGTNKGAGLKKGGSAKKGKGKK